MGNLCGCCNDNDASSEEATPRRYNVTLKYTLFVYLSQIHACEFR